MGACLLPEKCIRCGGIVSVHQWKVGMPDRWYSYHCECGDSQPFTDLNRLFDELEPKLEGKPHYKRMVER